jgi:uncharacterized protein (TIGR03435 family)
VNRRDTLLVVVAARRKVVLIVVGVAALAASLTAQNPSVPTQFEVASIKLNVSQGLPPLDVITRNMLVGAISSQQSGRFTMQGLGSLPAILLIGEAYNLKEFQILGAPSWATSERYDIDARAGGPATPDQIRLMLQSLLADRFKLTFRRETRQMPVYELEAGKDGLKIEAMKAGSCVPIEQAKPFAPLDICGGVRRQIIPTPDRRDVIEAVGVPVAKLIKFLSDETGRIVLDKTGFTDVFNFRLEFTSTLASSIVKADASANPGLSIFTAVEEQLGMRLRSTTGPVDVLLIDRLERPSPN